MANTLARMERDGLLTVGDDRHLELTDVGRDLATRVMRRHRIAECMLVQILHLDLSVVHGEACRWEHVMSERVERRLAGLLDHPHFDPYGNPIPGLDEIGEERTPVGFLDGVAPVVAVAVEAGGATADAAKRKEAYSAAVKLITEKAYWLPLFTYVSTYAFSKQLQFKTFPDELPRFYMAKWQ